MEAATMAPADFNDKVITMVADMAQVKTSVANINEKLTGEHVRVDTLVTDIKDLGNELRTTERRLIEKMDSFKEELSKITGTMKAHAVVAGMVTSAIIATLVKFLGK